MRTRTFSVTPSCSGWVRLTIAAALLVCFIVAALPDAPRDAAFRLFRRARVTAPMAASGAAYRIAEASSGASGHSLVPGVSDDWWSRVVQRLEEEAYQTVARGDAALEAANPAQNLRTIFASGRVEVSPGGDDGRAWKLGWRTRAWGRRGEMIELEPAPPRGCGARVEYAQHGLVEWYVNDRDGIEQGFTIDAPPARCGPGATDPTGPTRGGALPGRSPLIIEATIATDLTPALERSGRAVDFLDAHGECALRYGDLVVRDAHGSELEAAIVLDEDGDGLLALVIDDGGAAYPIIVDPLMSNPAWTAESDVANAQLGYSVASAGDVNGDGFSEVIVGAPLYPNGSAEAYGRVFVYMGSATGIGAIPAWSARPGFQSGNQEFGKFGQSVGSAGDVNGDGYDDIIVGGPDLSDDSNASEGHAYVWHGGPSGGAGGISGLGPSGTAANADWEAESDNHSANLGQSVATAGDVNGDGYDDVVVGAPFYGAAGNEGAAFVWLGSAGGLGADGTPDNADWRTAWVQADAMMGYSVAGAGDVNSDGFADLLLGAPGSTNGQAAEGAAFLWLGSAAGLGSNGTPLNADWYAESNESSAQLGLCVAAAGDVNGDGYGDVIIGAPNYDTSLANEGAAFVWFGGPDDLGASGSPANADWTARGNQAEAHFGTAVATAGDVNGDGFADVIVGAPDHDAGQNGEGRAYVYLGAGLGPRTAPAWVTESDQADAGYGKSVATAGDVNGDGFADVLVGAWVYDGGQVNEGRAYAYLGSGDAPEAVPAWSSEGNQVGATLGWSVACAGDVNGDGYSDILVSAINYTNGHLNEGRVLLYPGQSVDPSLVPVWTAESNQIGADFGWSVATAGDVNGDGYSDVIIGARDYDNGEEDEGAAFVWLGSAQWLGPSGTPTNADWRVEGNQVGAHFGVSVASAGDVNGDGYGDVIVGAEWYDNGQLDEGRAYVYHGSSSGLAATPDWTAERDQGGAYFGHSVASAGDVNRDGYSDVIIGAPEFDGGHVGEGRAWVYLGSPSGLAGTAAWFADIGQANTQFGSSVATAGDVNGDGFSDVIVGAWTYDNGQAGEGQVFVYLGAATGLGAVASWTADGDQINAAFGYSVATAGDVNGDGFSDVIIGAPDYDDGYEDEGRVFVYLGAASGLDPSAGWTAHGGQGGARFGHAVASVGDVTGDGFGDVIVGADLYDNPEGQEGGAFVFYGNGTNGLDRIPRQARADDSAPVDLLGRPGSESSFRLRTLGRTAAGRGRLVLEWEVKPLGVSFDGTGLGSGPALDTGTPTNRGSAVDIDQLVTGLAAGTAYHWRLRTVTRSPFFPRSPWLSLPGNCRTETDLRTNGGGVGIADAPAPGPQALRLALRPNPFTSRGTIAYELAARGHVALRIFDVTGRLASLLVDGAQEAGVHQVAWDGRDGHGAPLPSGIYFVRLAVNGEVRSSKIIIER